jgi:regulator of protease activity HflC (stomatin/prohibitin superfamily)
MHIETDKIYVQINGKRQEAKGEVLENLLQAQAEMQAEQNRIEAEQTKKDADRASAMAKLSKLGLTDDEIASLIP